MFLKMYLVPTLAGTALNFLYILTFLILIKQINESQKEGNELYV